MSRCCELGQYAACGITSWTEKLKYNAGVVLFVLTLQQGQYAYQFRQFAWTHLIVFFTVVPSSFFVPLMFEGLVWFFLPCGLIIVNDIMAYLAGASLRAFNVFKLRLFHAPSIATFLQM
jgi:CDP-diglyceride synthetase